MKKFMITMLLAVVAIAVTSCEKTPNAEEVFKKNSGWFCYEYYDEDGVYMPVEFSVNGTLIMVSEDGSYASAANADSGDFVHDMNWSFIGDYIYNGNTMTITDSRTGKRVMIIIDKVIDKYHIIATLAKPDSEKIKMAFRTTPEKYRTK